jgi:PAS domain S-box-containing protein
MTSSDDELLRLQALIDSAPLPMAAVRPDGYMLFANDHALALFGLRREDDPQQTALEFLIDPADHERLIAERLAGFTDSHELQMKRADGTPIQVLISSEMIVVGGEQLVISGLQDITRLRAAEAKLEESDRWYRTLIEKSQDMISTTDASLIITYTSPSTQQNLGYSPEELAGKQALELVHPDDAVTLAPLVAECLRTPGGAAQFRVRRARPLHLVDGVATNLLDDERCVPSW